MKIIVGVDGSDHAYRAVKWCAEYGKALGAEVIAVHAIDLPVLVSPMAGTFQLPQFSDVDRDQLRELMTRDWCAPLAKAGVPFRVMLMDSDPALGIIQAAKTEEADLVVAGRRGRGGFTELVLGSTTHVLTHHLDRPLVIVP